MCSEIFETHKGDSVSIKLFNLALEFAMRATTTNSGGTVFNRLTQFTAYADDVVIMAENVNALKQIFIKFIKEDRKLGLAVNIQKTK
jgi:hypothetical protein